MEGLPTLTRLDLDEAISLRRELLVLRPPGHRYRWGSVERLWLILQRRREVTGDDRDCKEIDGLRAELDAFEEEMGETSN